MTPAWAPIFGMIIGMNLVFAGFVMAFIVPKPAAPPRTILSWVGWKVPGYLLIIGGVAYAAIAFI